MLFALVNWLLCNIFSHKVTVLSLFSCERNALVHIAFCVLQNSKVKVGIILFIESEFGQGGKEVCNNSRLRCKYTLQFCCTLIWKLNFKVAFKGVICLLLRRSKSRTVKLLQIRFCLFQFIKGFFCFFIGHMTEGIVLLVIFQTVVRRIWNVKMCSKSVILKFFRKQIVTIFIKLNLCIRFGWFCVRIKVTGTDRKCHNGTQHNSKRTLEWLFIYNFLHFVLRKDCCLPKYNILSCCYSIIIFHFTIFRSNRSNAQQALPFFFNNCWKLCGKCV